MGRESGVNLILKAAHHDEDESARRTYFGRSLSNTSGILNSCPVLKKTFLAEAATMSAGSCARSSRGKGLVRGNKPVGELELPTLGLPLRRVRGDPLSR